MSDLLRLNCLVFGDDPSYIFPVQIATTETIGVLKKVIKDETKPHFDGVAAHHLLLWQVSLPVDDDLQQRMKHHETAKPLPAVAKLRDVFADPPVEGHLHVVVVVMSWRRPQVNFARGGGVDCQTGTEVAVNTAVQDAYSARTGGPTAATLAQYGDFKTYDRRQVERRLAATGKSDQDDDDDEDEDEDAPEVKSDRVMLAQLRTERYLAKLNFFRQEREQLFMREEREMTREDAPVVHQRAQESKEWEHRCLEAETQATKALVEARAREIEVLRLKSELHNLERADADAAHQRMLEAGESANRRADAQTREHVALRAARQAEIEMMRLKIEYPRLFRSE